MLQQSMLVSEMSFRACWEGRGPYKPTIRAVTKHVGRGAVHEVKPRTTAPAEHVGSDIFDQNQQQGVAHLVFVDHFNFFLVLDHFILCFGSSAGNERYKRQDRLTKPNII